MFLDYTVRPMRSTASALLLFCFGLTACGDDGGSPAPDPDAGTDDPDAGTSCPTGMTEYPLERPVVEGDSPVFPEGFLWGTATAPHQVEGGNEASDWYLWEQMDGKVAGGGRSDDGPNHWDKYADDLDLMQADGMNGYRMGIEWAKLFPTREAFDSLTPDEAAVQHYHDVFAAMASRGIQPMVTLHHFVSPAWLVDPTASAAERRMMGFASEGIVDDFERFATWAAQEYGGEVDLWITINEPLALVLGGYLVGAFPPGLTYDPADDLLLRVVRGQIFAHAAAYDALHEHDTSDADGDGEAALVSVAKHQRVMIPEAPCSTADAEAAAHIHYLMNVLFLEAIVRGDLDGNGDGDLDDPEDARADPTLAGRADFLGINYYGLSTVNGRVPISDLIPGIPSITDNRTDLPKNDLRWAIYPGGFRTVLEEAAEYGLPIYVTENGTADQGDVLRAPFLVDHLWVLAQAVADGVDVRGYFHWSMMDNFEWAEGYCPRFGLYRVSYEDAERPRTATEGAAVYRQIIEAGRVPSELVASHRSYGEPTYCE